MHKFFLHNVSYTFSFLLPFLLLGIVYAVYRVYPFGEGSILMGDQYNQYIQFYSYLYDVLKGNGSLLYSWEAGMGLNFWSTFAYYLSSPVSLVIIFFEKSNLPEAFIFMTLIKIGLSGLFMYTFVSKTMNIEPIEKLTFSTMYSLVSFATGYFFNIMWLDGLYLLPLVLLAVERLFQRKYIFLIICLSFLFISNFYMAYIVGVFTFLYFLYRSFSNTGQSVKTVFRNFIIFISCTLIAGGISAFITLPTYLALKSNSYQQLPSQINFDSTFGFFEFFSKLYNSSIQLFNLPNVFSGLLVLLLTPLFFVNSNIKGREKVFSFIFLIILFLSLQINGLNIIWHAFSAPTGYYQRFAFVLSFFLIFLASKSFLVFKKDDLTSLFKVYLVNIFLLMLLTKLTPELMPINKALVNMGLLTILSGLLYLRVTLVSRQRIISLLMLFFVCLDMGINAYNHLRTLSSNPGYNIKRSDYNIANTYYGNIVSELNNKDKSIYRTNTTIHLTPNDSLRYGYKGMTNFNTLSNGNLHKFIESIGYSSTLGSRSLAQNQGILSSDALFAFKYMVTDQPLNKYGYQKVKCMEETCLYKNINALPIGFITDKEQFDFKTEEDNPFEKQNILMGPVGENVSYFTPINNEITKYNNLEVKTVGNIDYFKKINPNQEGSIEMSFNVIGKKQFYTLLAAGKGLLGFNETNISVNGKSIGVYPTYHNERVLDLGAFQNERVTIKIEFLVPETQLTQQLFYTLDIPSFEKRIEEIRKQSFKVTNWTNTSVEGKINVAKPGSLFFSIPYDQGWTVIVDGNKVLLSRLGGFIGVDLESGDHTVKLSYRPMGFKAGCIISISSILVLIALTFILNRRKINKLNLDGDSN